MSGKSFTLLTEPKEDLYRKVIDYAVNECKTVLLVVRKSIALNSNGTKVLQQLDPYLKNKMESTEWPGTKLLEDTAVVHQYHFGPACAEILKRSAESLYEWVQPELPEDLCLLKDNEDPWLVSISHERDSYFILNEEARVKLLSSLPELARVLREDIREEEIK
jgi:hypothetical protein